MANLYIIFFYVFNVAGRFIACLFYELFLKF